MPTRRSRRRADSTRDALLAAATDEFALHGFAGASVDTIARRARVNKAMIYYHFKSKQRLYLEILRGIFSSIGDRTAEVAASSASAPEKIAEFARTMNREAEARPYLPPIMMREIAEGARRLDAETLRLMSRLFFNLRAILDQGAREGTLRRANPLLTYLSLISPVFFFRASLPIRAAMGRHNLVEDVKTLDSEVFLDHLIANLQHALAPEAPSALPAPSVRGSQASRKPRSGDPA